MAGGWGLSFRAILWSIGKSTLLVCSVFDDLNIRFEFLRVRYWESIEMFRKFCMTSLLVNVVAVGQPEQIASGR